MPRQREGEESPAETSRDDRKEGRADPQESPPDWYVAIRLCVLLLLLEGWQ